MANTTVTDYRRKLLCQITSGAIAGIPKVSYIALGDGGVDEEGTVLQPAGSQTALNHEVIRYAVEDVSYPTDVIAQYTITIPKDALPGVNISEAALVDEEGNLCAIRNMLPKGKDDDIEFVFEFADEF